MTLKIEQNPDLFARLAIQVENGPTCLFHVIRRPVCFIAAPSMHVCVHVCVCACVRALVCQKKGAPTEVVHERSRPVVT